MGVPLATKLTVPAGAVLAFVGSAMAQTQQQQQQLAEHLPLVLWIAGSVVGGGGLIVVIAKSLWALHGVAVKWVQQISASHLQEDLSAIREALSQLRGEVRVVRVALGGDPYPTPDPTPPRTRKTPIPPGRTD